MPNGPSVSIQIGMSLRQVERLIIEATLRHTDGNVSHTARILEIDRSTLHKKLKEYHIAQE